MHSSNQAPSRPRGRFQGFRQRVCEFCVGKVETIDYKSLDLLRNYVTARGKILSRRKTGACARHQRLLAVAIKRARYLALLPYVAEHVRTPES